MQYILFQQTAIGMLQVKGFGTGTEGRGGMAPTLLKTVDFGPPTFQCTMLALTIHTI